MDGTAYEMLRGEFGSKLIEAGWDLGTEEAKRIMTALDAVASGYCITRQSMELITQDEMPQIVKVYIVSKKIEGLSAGTLAGFMYTMKSFLAYVRKPLETTTPNDIRMFLYHYQEERGVSNRTLDHVRSIVSGFFRWAAAEGYMDKDPTATIKPIKIEIKQRQSLSQVELEYVRRACKTLRERAMIEFMYSTGCRVSELCVIKKEDVDFLTDEVHLFGKGKKHRTSYLNAKAHVAVKEYLEARTDDTPYLFVGERKPHGKLSKTGVEKIVRQISDACGLNKSITPHIFRHTTATQAVSNGMPVEEVQKLLGHANVATTMIYIDTASTNVKTAHRRAVI